MSYPNNSYPPPEQQPEPLSPDPRKRKTIIWAIVAAAAILFCCCAAVAALLIIDPFDWGLINIARENENSIARAVPADSTAYVGINLLNAGTARIDPLIVAFEDAFEDYTGERVADTVDIQELFDEGLQDLDITIEDDILPWVGRYAGMGLLNLELDRYGNPDSVDYYVAITTRNRDAADEFLVKLTDGIADANDVNIDTGTYQGTTIYIVEDPYDEMAFARHEGLVIMANSEDTIQELIDAYRGDSIADDAVYQDLMRELPSERIISLYIPGNTLEDISSEYISMFGLATSTIEGVYTGTTGVALSLSIVDAGLQFDSVAAYDRDELSDSQRQLLELTGRTNDAADQLPDDTLLYFAGQRLDLTWAKYYETLDENTDGDFENSLEELEDEIGFNPDTDLFPYLDGVYAIAVFPNNTGLLAEELDINLGFAIIAQTSNESALLDTIDQFNRNFEDLSGAEIDDVSTSDMELYEAIDTWSDQAMLAYGVGSGWFGFATSVDILEALPDPGSALSDSQGFRQAQNQLSGGMNIVGYIDLANGLDTIRDTLDSYDRDNFDESTFFLRPIETLIIGASPLSGNIAHSTFILVIPTSR